VVVVVAGGTQLDGGAAFEILSKEPFEIRSHGAPVLIGHPPLNPISVVLGPASSAGDPTP
jgi:hypothetical protein